MLVVIHLKFNEVNLKLMTDLSFKKMAKKWWKEMQ